MNAKLCTNVHSINIDLLLQGLGYTKLSRYIYVLETLTRHFTITIIPNDNNSVIFYMRVIDECGDEVSNDHLTLYTLMNFYIQKGTQVCIDDKTYKKVFKYNKRCLDKEEEDF